MIRLPMALAMACLVAATAFSLPALPAAEVASSAPTSEAIRAAVDKVRPSLVAVEALGGPRETLAWSAQARRLRHGSLDDAGEQLRHDGDGTGFIIDSRGYVLTCRHVVADADVVFVRLHDGRRLKVNRVTDDPLTDVAVLHIESDVELHALATAEAKDLQIGDWVLTIGHPYGLELSVSAGIVSSKEQTLEERPYLPLIQFDAASNPGNSGGPLVNMRGDVVGMSEGGYGTSSGFQGIGFATPIDLALRMARRLIRDGEISRPYFGLATQVAKPEIAEHLNAPEGGVIVCDIQPDTAGHEAGIEVGDVVTHVAGQPVPDNVEFFRVTEGITPGKPVLFRIVRSGKPREIQVTPTETCDEAAKRPSPEERDGSEAAYMDRDLGMTLEIAGATSLDPLGIDVNRPSVLITHVDPYGAAAEAGLCAGMAILRVEEDIVSTLEGYKQARSAHGDRQGTLMLLGAGNRRHFVLVRP